MHFLNCNMGEDYYMDWPEAERFAAPHPDANEQYTLVDSQQNPTAQDIADNVASTATTSSYTPSAPVIGRRQRTDELPREANILETSLIAHNPGLAVPVPSMSYGSRTNSDTIASVHDVCKMTGSYTGTHTVSTIVQPEPLPGYVEYALGVQPGSPSLYMGLDGSIRFFVERHIGICLYDAIEGRYEGLLDSSPEILHSKSPKLLWRLELPRLGNIIEVQRRPQRDKNKIANRQTLSSKAANLIYEYLQKHTLEYMARDGRRVEASLQTLYLVELRPVKKATMDIILAVAVPEHPGGLRMCSDFPWFSEARGQFEVHRG